MSSSWTIAAASVRGSMHEKLGMPCQDVHLCRVIPSHDGRDLLFALASDGASSAARSEQGAALTVASFFEMFTGPAVATPTLSKITRTVVERWVRSLHDDVADLAREAGIGTREYSCTFVGAIAGPESTVCVQVGDGAIIGAAQPGGPYQCLTWPQHGRSSVSTFFVTGDDVLDRLVVNFINRPMNDLAVFTDGIEDIVLESEKKIPCQATVRRVFELLLPQEILTDTSQSSSLAAFLSSATIADRSTDDTTLVLARRLGQSIGTIS